MKRVKSYKQLISGHYYWIVDCFGKHYSQFIDEYRMVPDYVNRLYYGVYRATFSKYDNIVCRNRQELFDLYEADGIKIYEAR